MNEQMNIGCKRGSKVTIRIRRCIVDKKNFIEARGGVGLVTTNVLDRVYWWVCKFEEMGWDMFKKKHGKLLCPVAYFCFLGGGEVSTLLKMGLRGTYYFVKIEMYLAAEIVFFFIIYKDLFLEKCIFSTTTWIILSFVLRTRHIIKCIRYTCIAYNQLNSIYK